MSSASDLGQKNMWVHLEDSTQVKCWPPNKWLDVMGCGLRSAGKVLGIALRSYIISFNIQNK